MDDVRENSPAILNDGCRRFVARALYAEYKHVGSVTPILQEFIGMFRYARCPPGRRS
jgi:hypothetical protein